MKTFKHILRISLKASLLFLILFVSCKTNPDDNKKPETKEEVTITIAYDNNVAGVSPKTLKIEKGSKWSDAKKKITITFKQGWVLKGWNVQNKDSTLGNALQDSHVFNEDIKIFASSKQAEETFSITITQPETGIITVKRLENGGETPLDASQLSAIVKNTNLKIELRAKDSAKHLPSKLNIDSDTHTVVQENAITHKFILKGNIEVSGELIAIFKITKTDVENGAITIERNHSGTLVPLLDSELVKIPQGKELKITLSGNAGFKPKSLSIKEEKKSASDVITTVGSNGKITKTITVNDNITLSGKVIADPNAEPLKKIEVDADGVKFNMINIPALDVPTKLCGQEGVTLDTYQFAETEVTQELYKKVMGSLPPDQPNPALEVQEVDKPLCPVAKITWYNAIAFCNELTIKAGMSEADCVYYSDEAKQTVYRKADGDTKKYPYVDWSKKGFRLPTEAEWEAAALARENKKYPGSDDLDAVAWYDLNGFETLLHKVATKVANAFGLYDMAGNVAEWVWDPYVESAQRNKSPIKKNPTYKHQKSGNSCAGAGTIRGGEYYAAYTTGQYECKGRDESVSKQIYDSVDGIATGIRLSRGSISVVYEKVNVKKILLCTYEMRQKEMQKAESVEGFEKEFFPFTDTVNITVEAEEGSTVTCSKNPITLNESVQEVIITVIKQGKGIRTYTLRLKKGGRRDGDVENGKKDTYTVADTGVTIDMISLASVHDVWLGNIDKPNNQPHKVSLSKYQISTTEVTQNLYKAVTGKNPSFFVEKYKVASDVQELRPVEQVNWYEAVAFCNMLTEKIKNSKDDCVYYDDANFTTVYTMEHAQRDITAVNKQTGAIPKTPYVKWENKGFRLPTEAEWEWASYGGEYGRYAGSNNLTDVAWCGINATKVLDLPAVTRQVGMKTANGYGLYDMAGNVYEWCSEWWDSATPNGGQDPKGPQAPKTKHKATRSSSYGLSELNKDRFEDVSRDQTFNTVFDVHKVCGIRLVCKLF